MTEQCENCGCTEVSRKAPMPGDYAGEAIELECGACGFPMGLIA